MSTILEGIFKGFVQWIYSLCLEIVQYIANSLLDVFQMDLNYFRQVAPVTDDILSIVIAAGWALLLGNLVFQAMKSMATGLGFEGEDPKLLFTRTFVFAFLLLASQQICEIGLGISSQVISLLQVPSSVTITIPDENNFSIGASWLLIVIIGIVVMWQFVKLCFEVAERYVVTALLVFLAPLAFGMGGSKNTADIFKGWCRMFGSMCVMMVMNVIFLKLLISAMGYVPSGVAVLPWMLLIVGIARVARKVDSIVARMGLNPAITGDGLGRGLPGMVAYAVVKGIGSSIVKAAGNSAGGARAKGGSSGGGNAGPRANPHTPSPPPPPPPGGSPSGSGGVSGSANPNQQKAGAPSQGQGGVFVSQHTAQETGRSSAADSQESTFAADTGRSAAEPRAGKAPTVHTHGARRSSVPPEARAGTRTAHPRGAAFSSAATPPDGTGESGTLGRSVRPDGRDPSRQASPVSHTYGPSGGKQPGEPGTTSRGGTRISAVSPGQPPSGKHSHTTQTTSTRETIRERQPIQRDGTQKITPPLGVGGGDGKPPRASSTPGLRPSAAAGRSEREHASVSTDKRPARPPVGGRQPERGDTASSGTAGTVVIPGRDVLFGGGTPSAGTAGKQQPTRMSHAVISGAGASSGMAGTPHSTGGVTQPSHSAPPSGMAGTGAAGDLKQPSTVHGGAPSGTAGTRRPGGSGRPQAEAHMPTSATAGSPPQGGKKAPGPNRGTRRLKQGSPAPPMSGGQGTPPKHRRKRSKP